MPPVLPLVEPLVLMPPPVEPSMPPVEPAAPVVEPLVDPVPSIELEPVEVSPPMVPMESELMPDSVPEAPVPLPASLEVVFLLSQDASRPVLSTKAVNNKEGFLINVMLKTGLVR